jgi:hypothetical protein
VWVTEAGGCPARVTPPPLWLSRGAGGWGRRSPAAREGCSRPSGTVGVWAARPVPPDSAQLAPLPRPLPAGPRGVGRGRGPGGGGLCNARRPGRCLGWGEGGRLPRPARGRSRVAGAGEDALASPGSPSSAPAPPRPAAGAHQRRRWGWRCVGEWAARSSALLTVVGSDGLRSRVLRIEMCGRCWVWPSL